jgi:hypothetical protein
MDNNRAGAMAIPEMGSKKRLPRVEKSIRRNSESLSGRALARVEAFEREGIQTDTRRAGWVTQQTPGSSPRGTSSI